MVKIDNDWKDFFETETKKDYYLNLRQLLKEEYRIDTIYPPAEEIFNAYKLTPLSKVKAVIIGQDPFHEKGQAMGLSFSVDDGVKIPPSLRNIYKEIESDLGIKCLNTGNLTRWAKQGVFLLNTCLTVRQGAPGSHFNCGWETFTDNTIRLLNENNNPKVFLLWGSPARKKKTLITNPNHLVLEAAHPSPLSASKGFFGCKHFSQTNKFLLEKGLTEIDWM